MKIFQVNKFYYLKGGAERYFLELSKLLGEKGHKIIPLIRDSKFVIISSRA